MALFWKPLYLTRKGKWLKTFSLLFLTLISELSELRTIGPSPQSLNIAVPSRIPSITMRTANSQRPLEGWRIAIKDYFHVKGVRTSACNSAYYELYPPASETAVCLTALVDAGAILVGKTKLASFTATEEPVECIDWQAPWNPRADGYESPAGSSSGSGAAIAAYHWLDISIGSDSRLTPYRTLHAYSLLTQRSKRKRKTTKPLERLLRYAAYAWLTSPRRLYAEFSVSVHLIMTTEIQGNNAFSRFDVPTFFGRDLQKCKKFAEEWYAKRHLAAVKVAVVGARVLAFSSIS